MKSSYIIREKLPQDQLALETMYHGIYPHPKLMPKITLVAERESEVMGSVCADFFDNDLYVFLASKRGHYSPFMAKRLIDALDEVLKKAGAVGYFIVINKYHADARWLNLAYEFLPALGEYSDGSIFFVRTLK